MTEYLQNPAGRLHAFLFKLYSKNRGKTPPAWDACAELLAPGQSKTSSQVFIAVAEVVQLPDQVRERVAALSIDEDEKAELLEDLEKIELGLGHMANRGHNLQSMFVCFAPGGDVPQSAAVRTLLTCARRLQRARQEPEVPADDLRRFAEEITALMELVQEAELGQSAKFLLLHHLHALLQAVQHIRITGTVPIEEALDAFVGAMRRQPEATAEVVKAPFIARLKSLLETVNSALTIARSGQVAALEGAHVVQQGEALVENGAEHILSLLS
ncbi:hypothetical protein [Streptomyces sp. IBSBF 2435]|uniref:hypothetical protein n=1 Tax=Streptomyces sp. IBSBF 2435 TaxID=2903531 RepID=UPI002FDC41CB